MASIKETLDLPLSRIMSMSKNELRIEVQRLSMESNKRLAYFKKRGISTPATAYIKKHGGKFTSKNKDLTQLREEFQRAKGFLESETGNIKGYREWETRVANTLMENTGIDYNSLTELQKRKFWNAYAKLEELDQANIYGANYRGSVKQIYKQVKGGATYDQLEAFVNDLHKTLYEKQSKNFLKGKNNPLDLANKRGKRRK